MRPHIKLFQKFYEVSSKQASVIGHRLQATPPQSTFFEIFKTKIYKFLDIFDERSHRI